MADSITTLTEASLDDASASSDIPLVVDLWADGCGPCQTLMPILERVADEYTGKLKVAKLKVDDAPNVWARFDVATIPTLLVFVDGQLTKTIVQPQGEDGLMAELGEFLSLTTA